MLCLIYQHTRTQIEKKKKTSNKVKQCKWIHWYELLNHLIKCNLSRQKSKKHSQGFSYFLFFYLSPHMSRTNLQECGQKLLRRPHRFKPPYHTNCPCSHSCAHRGSWSAKCQRIMPSWLIFALLTCGHGWLWRDEDWSSHLLMIGALWGRFQSLKNNALLWK